MAASVGAETDRVVPVPVSFQDLGIPAPPKLQDTVLGKARKFDHLEWKERVYIVVTIFTLLATFGFTLYKICTVASSDPDFTFALVLLVSTLFAMYYTVHGVLQERATEILVLCVAITIVLIYLIVNYTAGRRDTIKLVRLIVAAVLCPFLIGMGVYLSYCYYSTGNLIFRMVGANTQLQNMCRLLFLFFDVLKFDLQLSISMVILILTSRLEVDTEDIVVLSAGGVITIGWFLLAYDCMKRESKAGAIIFFAFSPLEVAYIIFKLYQTSDYIEKFSGLAGSTIACGVIALFIRALVIIAGVFVFRNFNKGLKEKAFGIQSQPPAAQPQPSDQGDFVP
ncbi:uncharacterized protein LOC143275997 [Babylonia areolata]|uniref:uncharacterized protein LOC143275997 n=1 Tax=Babylonia areolata TaxID=304850 RepID=UPI003FD00B10